MSAKRKHKQNIFYYKEINIQTGTAHNYSRFSIRIKEREREREQEYKSIRINNWIDGESKWSTQLTQSKKLNKDRLVVIWIYFWQNCFCYHCCCCCCLIKFPYFLLFSQNVLTFGIWFYTHVRSSMDLIRLWMPTMSINLLTVAATELPNQTTCIFVLCRLCKNLHKLFMKRYTELLHV